MKQIDFHELYAANRAAIDAARPRDIGTRPARPVPTFRPRLTSTRSPDPAPGGTGDWERRAYAGSGGGRSYFVYTPPSLRGDPDADVVVMLHGCTQTAAGLARSTRMNTVADRHGFVVVYPQQADAANPQRCWNWFLPAHQARGAGEAAIVAGISREVSARPEGLADRRRVFLVGMSAGGAMAAVLAAAYPDVFSAIGVHSGLAYRAATSQQEAFSALAGGAARPAALGREAFAAMGSHARIVPTIVVHGTADHTVAAVNADQLVEQWLGVNRLAAPGDLDGALTGPSEVVGGQAVGGYRYTRARWLTRTGRPVQEYLKVDGLGHAWSGGARAAFSDPRGPDASEAIWDFFARNSQAGSR